MNKIYNVGIIGGGVSGVVTALEMAKHNIDSILFEQANSVVNGPPFCHLHAGGNLYPDISDEQCRILMKQSIAMARLFPESIDQRPTFISVPKSEKYDIHTLLNRLDMLVGYYQSLIDEDPSNEILGAPQDYYNLYTEVDLIALSEQPAYKRPTTPDQWMANTVKLIDYKKLKTPVILVQEYGWNLFRLGAQAQLALEQSSNCSLKTNTNVNHIKDVRAEDLDYNWEIQTKNEVYKVKYLVNSSGYKTGQIEASLQLKTERLIEFKAAYVSKWEPQPGLLPELIFHGERGTPNGMVQLTPYAEDFYQIHGMTEEITLFKDGLIKSKANEAQPQFNEDINLKLYKGWATQDVESRTENAIASVGQFVPSFKTATVGGPPLFGAQQIRGNDPNLRVGEVSFPSPFYARSEIIKASSALTVAHQIIAKLQEENIIPALANTSLENEILEAIDTEAINRFASQLAKDRGYPEALSRLVIERQ